MQNWRKLNILAQLDNPTKGDWVLEVKESIIEYEIGTSYEEVSEINKIRYERVQPVGLISLSCNWVILHNEIDQM